jgi:mono/diheme cytochrome c family protein
MGTTGSKSEAPLPSAPQPPADKRPAAQQSTRVRVLFKGIVNLVSILLVIYLTYFFTTFFATRPAGAPSPTEAEKALARKAEELRAQDHKVLSSYGWVNAATKSVRIPVERAMELTAAENAQPVPTATPAAATVSATSGRSQVANVGASPGVSAAPATPTGAAPTTAAPAGAAPAAVATVAAAPAPARVGWSPEQVYVMVCSACHEPDGRGTKARKEMKDAELIPDLTDPKWQASRTDADLAHSILEGKGKVMLARKDILGLAHLDVREMVALMRGFQGGKQVVSGVPTGQPVPAQPVQVAAGPSATAPVAPPSTPTPSPVQPIGPAAGQSATTSTSPAPPLVAHPPTGTAGALVQPPSVPGAVPPSTRPPQLAGGPGPPAPAAAPPASLPAVLPASGSTTGAGTSPSAVSIAATKPSREQAARLRVASEFYRTNCFACHGLDGTGSLTRPLMPAIPDFTNRQWQTSRSNTQLQTSILEGKGTLMPPWTGKFTAEFARDLISYVRTFGPPELLTSTLETRPSNADFELRLSQLKARWDEVEKQLAELNLPAAKP